MIRFLIVFLFCATVNGQFVINSYAYAVTDPNIYTTANSLNPSNEANATITTAFIDADLTLSSQTSSPISPYDGTYYWLIDVDNTSGANDRIELVLEGITNGQNVTISIWADEVVGAAYTLALNTADGWTTGDAVNTAAGGWTEYTLTDTATQDDPKMRITALSASAAGDQLALDNLTITVN